MVKEQELFVVTGGSRGIGLAIAKAAVNQGKQGRLVLISRRPPLKESFPTLTTVLHISADLGTLDGMEEAIAQLRSLGAPIGVLINNAGQIAENDSFAHVTHQTLVSSLQLHVLTPTFLTKALFPQLCQATNPSVINIGSIYGNVVDPDIYAYAVSKSSVPLVTQMMARVYGPKVRVNCVLPGHIDTEMTRAAPAEFIAEIVKATPAQRLGSSTEVAQVVLFLASEEAKFISGATVRVDGGYWRSSP